MKIVAILTLIFGVFILSPFWFYKVFTSPYYKTNLVEWHNELNSWIFTKPLYWGFVTIFDGDESKVGW